MLSSITAGGLTLWALAICSLLSIVLGLVIAFVHTKTSKFSKNFAITLVVLPILVQIVMMMVSGNIGTGIATDVLTVANTLIKNYGIDVPVTVSGNYRLGDIRHNFADISLAKNILGYEPKWTFEQGIEEFSKWVNQQEIQEDKYDASIEEMKEKGLYK